MKNIILDVIHETAKGLTEAGAMDMQTMRKFDALCLPEVEKYDARRIKTLQTEGTAVNLMASNNTKTSIDFLDEVKDIQQQRAAEYEQEGGERSFAKIATIYNTLRGADLKPSDVALILCILKDVRAYSQDKLHMDSLVDKISYASLWAELVTQERGG